MAKLLLIIFTILSISVFAQNKTDHRDHESSKKNHHHSYKRHSISILNGLTFIPESISEHDIDQIQSNRLNVSSVNESPRYVQTWGVNYQYKVNNRLGIGIINDIELEKYAISHSGDILARDNVIVSSLVVYYDIISGLEIFGGAGYEFERDNNLFVWKVGVEYNLFIANDFYVAPELAFDIRKEYWNYTFGFKLTKFFGKLLD
ncbi:hypothetical protein [Aureibacter tunicatorum]|uniref:Secreted protein n=1 Tax=Aureibacter tunicatorum TaxID=866807 RepID=A0AAE3XTI1_9BACT|nr:hypothetical protein [Aureibacter tunicatorum]MDR6241576.1 hypothetical protein [Aureibacter tunicatorum]BDD07200.1 hypothetical protein AUTU_46830 [Aureibacter tunicatorum]